MTEAVQTRGQEDQEIVCPSEDEKERLKWVDVSDGEGNNDLSVSVAFPLGFLETGFGNDFLKFCMRLVALKTPPFHA